MLSLVLIEALIVLASGVSCLLAFGFVGARPDDPAWVRWYRTPGRLLRGLGLFGLWVSGCFPILYWHPVWLPTRAVQGCALLTLMGLGALIATSWRSSPAVHWPQNAMGWASLLVLQPLVLLGVSFGMLDWLGLDTGPIEDHRLWLWYLPALGMARLLQVWFARLLHHAEQP